MSNYTCYHSINRITNFLYSVYKLNHVKSLKMKYGMLITIISLTVALPYNLFQILLASILRIPVLHLFGLPLNISSRITNNNILINKSIFFFLKVKKIIFLFYIRFFETTKILELLAIKSKYMYNKIAIYPFNFRHQII